jgi:uncharacterized protein
MRRRIFDGAIDACRSRFVVSLIEVKVRREFMKCPMCGKPTKWKDNPDRPFCSERCRVIDLGKWASEDYRVETPLKDSDDKAEPPQP